VLDQLLVVRLNCEVSFHRSLTEKVFLLLGVLEELTVLSFFSLRNLVVEMLDIFESSLRNVLSVCKIILGASSKENEGLVILDKITINCFKMSMKALLFFAILCNYTNFKEMIFMLHENCKMLFTCLAILFVGISEKIKKVLILNLSHNFVNSWGRSLAFIFVFIHSLLNVDSHSIEHAIETCSVVIGILHRIVSQNVEIHISTSHARVLLVGDGYVHIQTEVFQSKRLSKMVK
jgi:hypothetical protein